MKRRDYFILPLIASAFSFTACEKKSDAPAGADSPGETPKESVVATPPAEKVSEEKKAEEVVVAEETAKEAVEKVAEETVEKVEELVKPLVPGSIEELSGETGFAKYVPKGSSAYFGVYDGAELVKKVLNSKLGAFVEKVMEEEGASPEEIAKDPDFQQFATIAGEEMFFAVGEGAPEQTKNLMVVNNSVSFHQMKFYVKMLEFMISGKDIADHPMFSQDELYLFDVAKDEKNIEAFTKAEMPALYAGFKVSDEEKRAMLLEQIQGLGEQALEEQDVELLVAAEAKVGGGFKGVSLKGDLLLKQMEGEVEDMMNEQIGKEAFAKYKKAIASKNLVMLAGTVDDYIVFFCGSSVDQLKLADSPAESILANSDMAFAKNFAKKDILGLVYSSEELQKVSAGSASGLKDVARGLSAGLKESESFGDTRVVEALLDDLVEREKSLYEMTKGERLGVVAYLEDGLKVELYGGSNAPSQDFSTGRALASMTEGEDILFSANWVSNPQYTELMMEYTDALGETAYQLTKQASNLDIEAADFKEFSAGFQMFDGMFREDLVKVWQAIRVDLAAGLGSESAVIVDINGELPTIPEVPKPIIDHGTVPRISYVSTVESREKLGQSWDKINTAAESILVNIHKMGGPEISMQRPFKNSNDGLSSYTFPIPTTHQNCTPTVVVGDELFFIATSPDFTGELAKKFDKSKPGAPGATMTLDFDVLSKWAKHWADLLDEHGEKFMSKAEMEEFNEGKDEMKELFEALDELDHLKVNTRKEDGEFRASLHFKVK